MNQSVIAERLIAFRKQAKLSQTAVADLLSVTRQAVSKWESGKASPSLDAYASLAALYHVTPDEILTGKPFEGDCEITSLEGETFAERLKQLRTLRGISQIEVSESLSVSRQSVSKWERGESEPDADRLIALCALFSAPLSLVFPAVTPAVTLSGETSAQGVSEEPEEPSAPVETVEETPASPVTPTPKDPVKKEKTSRLKVAPVPVDIEEVTIDDTLDVSFAPILLSDPSLSDIPLTLDEPLLPEEVLPAELVTAVAPPSDPTDTEAVEEVPAETPTVVTADPVEETPVIPEEPVVPIEETPVTPKEPVVPVEETPVTPEDPVVPIDETPVTPAVSDEVPIETADEEPTDTDGEALDSGDGAEDGTPRVSVKQDEPTRRRYRDMLRRAAAIRKKNSETKAEEESDKAPFRTISDIGPNDPAYVFVGKNDGKIRTVLPFLAAIPICATALALMLRKKKK